MSRVSPGSRGDDYGPLDPGGCSGALTVGVWLVVLALAAAAVWHLREAGRHARIEEALRWQAVVSGSGRALSGRFMSPPHTKAVVHVP